MITVIKDHESKIELNNFQKLEVKEVLDLFFCSMFNREVDSINNSFDIVVKCIENLITKSFEQGRLYELGWVKNEIFRKIETLKKI